MIKRYRHYHEMKGHIVTPEGDWVLYSDHLKEVERLKRERDEDITDLVDERDFYKKAASEDAKLFDQAKSEFERLKELVIWMTGCGYDFTQHEFYMKEMQDLIWSEPPGDV